MQRTVHRRSVRIKANKSNREKAKAGSRKKQSRDKKYQGSNPLEKGWNARHRDTRTNWHRER